MKAKPPQTSEEERARRLVVAVRCARRHVKTRDDRETREIQMLALAAVGNTDQRIADRLDIQASTVGAYWKRVLERLGARTRTEAVAAVLLMEIHRLREQIAELRAEPMGEQISRPAHTEANCVLKRVSPEQDERAQCEKTQE